jgi:hypothetical protein
MKITFTNKYGMIELASSPKPAKVKKKPSNILGIFRRKRK